jgi:hypothetical protein
MASNPLDMIAAQALALRQQADALYLLVESLQVRKAPTETPSAGERGPARVARSFDNDGAPVMSSPPLAVDGDGDLRPTFST